MHRAREKFLSSSMDRWNRYKEMRMMVFLYIYKLLLLTNHATHNNKPDYLTELLTNYKSSRPQRTIHKYKLNIPITLSLNKKQESSFSIISPKLWNSLPYSIRSIVSDHTFKVKLKTHLFNPFGFINLLKYYSEYQHIFLINKYII